IAVGAGAAGLAVVAEALLPGGADMLHGFHGDTFQVFGFMRASGPFQYPNIAAMYFEAVLPPLLVVGAAAAGRSRRRWWIATAAGALVVIEALVLTASRAGLVTAAVVLVALAFWDRRSRRRQSPSPLSRAP